jgi:hypothetical protein
MRASRIISATTWIFVHDDRPAVTTTTASAAHVARCSPPTAGSRVARVSSRSAEAQEATSFLSGAG